MMKKTYYIKYQKNKVLILKLDTDFIMRNMIRTQMCPKVLKGKEQTVGYGYDELKDFDMGYRGSKYKIITPFLGENR